MRRLVAVVAGGLLWLSCVAFLPQQAQAALEVEVSGRVAFTAVWGNIIFPNNNTFQAQDVAGGSSSSTSPLSLVNPARDHDQFSIDASRSRIQIDVKDEVPGVKLAARIQGDFATTDGSATTSNSRHFRLRLAYAQGTTQQGFTLRAGQVRSMLAEFADNVIGGVGVSGALNENDSWAQLQSRQPALQLAWIGKIAQGDLSLGLGVEKSSYNNLGSTAVAEDQGEGQDIPLFTAGVRYRSPLFAVFARGAGGRAKVILAAGNSVSQDVWLGAIGFDVTPIAILRIYGQYWYSDGLSRVNGTFANGALCSVAVECSVNSLVNVVSQGYHAGVQLLPTKDWELNAFWQWVQADPSFVKAQATGAALTTLQNTTLRKAQAFNANFIYKFWTRWDTGIEYQHAWLDSFGQSDKQADFVYTRVRFYF